MVKEKLFYWLSGLSPTFIALKLLLLLEFLTNIEIVIFIYFNYCVVSNIVYAKFHVFVFVALQDNGSWSFVNITPHYFNLTSNHF